MKSIIVFLLICLSTHISAQTYQIIQTRGKVMKCATKQPLLQGDKINSTNGVCFIDQDEIPALAALINLDNGTRYLLKAGTSKGDKQKNQLIAMRTDAGNQGGRVPMNVEEEIQSLKGFFGKGNRVILGNESSVKLHKIVMSKRRIGNYFNAEYMYKGKKIRKRLPVKEGKLMLNKVHLFTVDGKLIDLNKIPLVTIIYMDYNRTPVGATLGKIYPTFLPPKQVVREFNLITATPGNRITSRNGLVIQGKLMAYLEDFYGSANYSDNRFWMQKYLAAKMKKK